MIIDKTEVYNLSYIVLKQSIYINLFSINSQYRGKGYSYKIINDLQNKYQLPITLECWPTLLDFYHKLGFKKLYENKTESGYYEMIKHI